MKNVEYGKFNVRMPKALMDRADRFCEAKGISRNAAINMALADWVTQQEKLENITSTDAMKELMFAIAKSKYSQDEE